MKYYLKCCSCFKPMQRRYKTCEECYQRYLNGFKYNHCLNCDYVFGYPSGYGLCFYCYQEAVRYCVEI